MNATSTLSALVRELSTRDRASLAVELIDSLGDDTWDDEQLAKLADERDAELESGAVAPLTHAQFLAGLKRPSECSMSLEYHPSVQRDVNEIIAYYEREAGMALAERFSTALQKQLAVIAAHPERCSPYPPNPRFQRAFIPRFPHAILFRMKAGRPRITAVKHQSRHPDRGLGRW